MKQKLLFQHNGPRKEKWSSSVRKPILHQIGSMSQAATVISAKE